MINGIPAWNTAPSGTAEVIKVTMVDPSDEYSPFVLNKTWNEIKTFVDTGTPIIIQQDFSENANEDYYISIGLLYSITGGETYSVTCVMDSEGWYGLKTFYANTSNDYPQTI